MSGIDVAGRLIRKQQFRAPDHGARNRRALLLAAGQHLGISVHAFAKPDPAQELGDILAIIFFPLAENPQGESDVLPGGQMVEQAKILKDDADTAPHLCLVRTRYVGDVFPEDGDQTAGRLQRHEQQAQQRRLAGAGGPGEKVKRTGKQVKGDVAQDFGTAAIAQSDPVKSNHAAPSTLFSFHPTWSLC